MEKGQHESHPSYGMVSVSRVNGNPGPLFGSTLDNHYTSFRIRISQGRRGKSVGNESHYIADRSPFVEIQLSAVQFTELITNMNSGDGIPCTITNLGGEKIESPPIQDLERNQIKDGFKERVKNIFSKLGTLQKSTEELLEKKTLSKSDRAVLVNQIQNIRMEVEANLPFVMELFDESTEKSINAARMEVDAFVTNHLVNLGREHLTLHLIEEVPVNILKVSEE